MVGLKTVDHAGYSASHTWAWEWFIWQISRILRSTVHFLLRSLWHIRLAESGWCLGQFPFCPVQCWSRMAIQRLVLSLFYSLFPSCSCLFLPRMLTHVWGELVHIGDLLENSTPPKVILDQWAELADFSIKQCLESEQGRILKSSAYGGGWKSEVLLFLIQYCILSMFENSTFSV